MFALETTQNAALKEAAKQQDKVNVVNEVLPTLASDSTSLADDDWYYKRKVENPERGLKMLELRCAGLK